MINKKLISFTINNCSGCGFCYTQYPDFFIETDDGKATSKIEICEINDSDYTALSNLCPFNALNMVPQDNLIHQELNRLLEELKNYKIKHILSSNVPFDDKEYECSIDIPFPEGEYDEHSSRSAANRAASQEFYKMYSQIDVFIIQILTEYKMNYIKQYYTKEKHGFFYESNKKLEKLLLETKELLKSFDLSNDLPDDFTTINTFPDNDIYWDMLNGGEILSHEMISIIKSSGYPQNSSNYDYLWDIDDLEDSTLTLFGNVKSKSVYYYSNLYNAYEELAKDILFAFYLKNDVIEDKAVNIVNSLIDTYNKQISDILNAKLSLIENKLSLLFNEE